MTIVNIGHVCPVVDPKAIVKLVPATTAEIVGSVVATGGTHVGELGKSEANDSHCNIIRLWAVTAVVLMVYVVVVVGMTTAPEAADPQAAGEAELTAQLVAVL